MLTLTPTLTLSLTLVLVLVLLLRLFYRTVKGNSRRQTGSSIIQLTYLRSEHARLSE
jgi:hypothetical protein